MGINKSGHNVLLAQINPLRRWHCKRQHVRVASNRQNPSACDRNRLCPRLPRVHCPNIPTVQNQLRLFLPQSPRQLSREARTHHRRSHQAQKLPPLPHSLPLSTSSLTTPTQLSSYRLSNFHP